MPHNQSSGAAPFAVYRRILPLSVSAALSETPGWLAPPLVGLTLIADGYSATVAGIVSSLPAAGIITMSAVLPAITQRVGAVRLFYGAAVILAVSLSLLVLASETRVMALWCAGSYGVGLAASMRWVLSDGFISHLAVSGERGRLLGFHETIRSCALGFGPLIAAFSTGDPARGFLVALGMTLIGAVLTVRMQLPAVPIGRARFADLAAGVRLAPAAFAVAFLCGVLEGVAAATVPLYAVTMGLSAATGALLAAASGFGNIVGQLPFGAYADARGPKLAIRWALLVSMLALAGLHLAMTSAGLAGLLMLVFGAAAGALYTLAVMETARASQGHVSILQMLAAIAVLYTIGDLAGPIIGGVVLDHAPPIAVPGLFLLACLATLWIAERGLPDGTP